MKEIKIIADSTCDLSKELIEKYDIDIFPLHVHLNENEYRDGIDITPDEIYEWSNETGKTPKTSALSPFEAKQYLGHALSVARHVLCFTISERMSSCCSVMYTVAREMGMLDYVHIIDSSNLSTGIGLQILMAADMVEKGYSYVDILKHIEEIQPKVNASFVVDSLTYLHRGGRCGGVAKIVGNSLKLHPKIYVKDKEMHVGKFYQGSLKRVLRQYVNDLKQPLMNARKDRVFITHSGMDEALIMMIKHEVEELNHFDEILITRAGSIISSHCGPNTLGILFIENE